MIRIVAADNEAPFLDALKGAIGESKDLQLVATSNHVSDLIDLVREYRADVAILGLSTNMGKFDPVACVRVLKEQFPNVKILVLPIHANDKCVRPLAALGVEGCLLKSEVLSAIEGNTPIKMVRMDSVISPDQPERGRSNAAKPRLS